MEKATTIFTPTVREILCQWLDLGPVHLDEAIGQALSGRYRRREDQISGRSLQIPTGPLYTTQSLIQHRLLRTAPISSAAHGGVWRRSVVTHVRVHLPDAQSLLVMDLSDAYGSVSRGLIIRTLRELLRPICQELLLSGDLRLPLARSLAWLCTVDGRLPMGSPTSTSLLNLAAGPLDQALERLTRQELGSPGRYSRYLDDLVFSSNARIPEGFSSAVSRAIRTHDLGHPNPNKTRSLCHLDGDNLAIMDICQESTGLALTSARLGKLRARVEKLAHKASLSGEDTKIIRGITQYLRVIYGPDRIPPDFVRLEADLHRGGRR